MVVRHCIVLRYIGNRAIVLRMNTPALREPTYFILSALLDGPSHGYAIAQTAKELSGGRVDLGAGTLYGALTRLEDEGLIEAVDETVVSGRKRRVFELTGSGRDVVRSEADRLSAAASVVHQRLAGTVTAAIGATA